MSDNRAQLDWMKISNILTEVKDERLFRHKAEGTPRLPDGTGGFVSKVCRAMDRTTHNLIESSDDLTWYDLLHQQVSETMAEEDPENLRRGLVQCAALIVAWVECIDEKGGLV